MKVQVKLLTKYQSKVDVMPSYEQIKNYIRYRREQSGNTNSLDQVKTYMSKKCFNPVLCEDNSMFCFGEKIGTGTDTDN